MKPSECKRMAVTEQSAYLIHATLTSNNVVLPLMPHKQNNGKKSKISLN